ncbi:MAG: hypothetical protein JXB20_06125, partial [Bacilli bacterium]|nr:hypothetical protein [Bacilli bacterium]
METKNKVTYKELLEKEIRGCFDFFWETSNNDVDSPGYGLVLDSTRNSKMATIAGVGFALSAYVIGVKRGYISFEQGYARCLGTLKTVYERIEKAYGLYVHFVDIESGLTWGRDPDHLSEYSTIDTALMLMGALAAGEFFKGNVKELAEKMIEEVDWEATIGTSERTNKKVFRMAYHGEKRGWSRSSWDHYAEHLMMYFLFAGQEKTDPNLAQSLYFGFSRDLGSYKGKNYVHSHTNALFIHQFSHAFIDFSRIRDMKGFDWQENSASATLANRQWCLDQDWSETFKQGFWGLTASHARKGYHVAGGPPWGFEEKTHFPVHNDGTVAPYAPLCSVIFTPDIVFEQLEKYANMSWLWGKYGLYDAFSFDPDKWCSKSYLAIDKGPTIIMLDNYENKTIQELVMNSDLIKKAIVKLGFHYHDDVSSYSNK